MPTYLKYADFDAKVIIPTTGTIGTVDTLPLSNVTITPADFVEPIRWPRSVDPGGSIMAAHEDHAHHRLTEWSPALIQFRQLDLSLWQLGTATASSRTSRTAADKEN